MQISSDLSTIDLDIPFSIQATFATTAAVFVNLGVLTAIVWQVLFVTLPVIYIAVRLQVIF